MLIIMWDSALKWGWPLILQPLQNTKKLEELQKYFGVDLSVHLLGLQYNNKGLKMVCKHPLYG